MCLSFWFCHLLKDFSVRIFLGVRYFWYSAFSIIYKTALFIYNLHFVKILLSKALKSLFTSWYQLISSSRSLWNLTLFNHKTLKNWYSVGHVIEQWTSKQFTSYLSNRLWEYWEKDYSYTCTIICLSVLLCLAMALSVYFQSMSLTVPLVSFVNLLQLWIM